MSDAQALRRWAAAAAQAGLGVGVVDAAIAVGATGARLAPFAARAGFALALGAACALAAAPFGALGALAWRLAVRIRPSRRPLLAQLVGAALGLAGGFAALSGSAIRRAAWRPFALLAVAGACALAAQRAWARRGVVLDALAQRPRGLSRALFALSVALYLTHAFVLVRLYPFAHALAAAGAVAALTAALGRGTRAAGRRGPAAVAAVALAGLAGGAAVMRNETWRALARTRAPVGSYLVSALGRALPRRAVLPTVRDERALGGHGYDFGGLDVVLVTVDALRADRLAAYGGAVGLTPRLDALAARGVLFERAYSTTPSTSYALASLMTGKYFREIATLGALGHEHETLAATLAGAGYLTAGFYPPAVFFVDGAQLGPLRDRGFDLRERTEGYRDAAARVRDVDALLARTPAGQRVFVWVHFFEPHEPYEPHAGARVSAVRGDAEARYAAEVAAVDDAFGDLERVLDRRGRRAAWIVTADHGEEFGEHGGRFHGTTLYDEQSRIPLIIAGPGIAPERVLGPSSLVDVMPTVLSALGLARPPRLRGRDLGALARAEAAGVAPPPVFGSVGTLRMTTDGRVKLVCDVAEGSCELFDLVMDPREQRNLIGERGAQAAELRQWIAGWQESHGRAERAEGSGEPRIPPVLERAIQGDRSAAAPVAALLDDARGPLAFRAVRALAALGESAPTVTAALARALRRPDAALAREAGVALALLGDRRGLAEARAALATGAPDDARRGALALARLGDAGGVDALCRWVADAAAPEAGREEAFTALDRLRDRRALSTWIELLADGHFAPRAAQSLGALGDARAIAPLRDAARASRYVLLRRAALGALALLAPGEARALVGPVFGGAEPAPDPFPLLTRLGAARSGAAELLVHRGRSALPRAVAREAFAAFLLVRTRADAPVAVTLDGTVLHLEAGTHDYRAPLAGGRGAVVLEANGPFTLLGAAVVPRAP